MASAPNNRHLAAGGLSNITGQIERVMNLRASHHRKRHTKQIPRDLPGYILFGNNLRPLINQTHPISSFQQRSGDSQEGVRRSDSRAAIHPGLGIKQQDLWFFFKLRHSNRFQCGPVKSVEERP